MEMFSIIGVCLFICFVVYSLFADDKVFSLLSLITGAFILIGCAFIDSQLDSQCPTCEHDTVKIAGPQ